MQTAVRKRAADFDFWGDTPTPEFCENSHERGSRSPAGTAQGFDPPLGSRRNAAGAARRLCRSQAGGGALAAVCLGGRGAGVVSPGRRGQGAVPGASGTRGAGAFLPGGGGKPGAGGLARVKRTKAAWRARRRGAGNVAGRRGAGGLRGFPGRTRGRRGGRQGRGGSPLPGRGGRRRGKNGCTQRGLCRVSGHLCDKGGGRAKKPVFAL